MRKFANQTNIKVLLYGLSVLAWYVKVYLQTHYTNHLVIYNDHRKIRTI